MNYATTAARPNPLAALGALGVPAGVGLIMIAGLAVNIIIQPSPPMPTGTHVPPDVVVTPEPIKPDVPPSNASQSSNNTSAQTPAPTPVTPDVNLGQVGPIAPLGGVGTGSLLGSEGLGAGLPPIPPVVDPVDASPRGNPANWITTADYRTSWIVREYTGTARFTLEIDATGRVSDCNITGSTGHAVLDRATCTLLERRAIFNPAKSSDGEAVAGTYASSVNWTIPE